MRTTNRALIPLVFILLLFSCQTNKAPRWIEEPPADDELYIYVVGIGEGDGAFRSVIDQLNRRFNIKDNEFLTALLMQLMKDSYSNSARADNSKVSVIAKWFNDDISYILVRLDRAFFEPIAELYSTRYEEMMSYMHMDEVDADILLEAGELYDAANNYLSALEYMLNQNDPFYNISIAHVLDKLSNLLDRLKFQFANTFSTLFIAHPLNEKSLQIGYGEAEETLNYSGFLYEVEFVEGWNRRARTVNIPIRDNLLEFVPPIPKVGGTYHLDALLNLQAFLDVVETHREREGLAQYIEPYIEGVEGIIDGSRLEFDYDVLSDLKSFPKVIAFDNSNVSEGVARYLLEKEETLFLSKIPYNSDLSSYIRDINIEVSKQYRYLVLGKNITEERDVYEGGLLLTLTGEYSVVDLIGGYTVAERTITSEFLVGDGEESLAYLDLGLKIGALVYDLSF